MILKPGDVTHVSISLSVSNTEETDVELDIDYLQSVLQILAIGFVKLEKKLWKK